MTADRTDGSRRGAATDAPFPASPLPFIAALLFVTLLLLLPLPSAPGEDGWLLLRAPGLDKVVHLVLFWMLAWLGARTMVPVRASLPALLLGLAAHGALLEVLQGRLAGRVADPLDWLADVAGILGGIILATRSRASNR